MFQNEHDATLCGDISDIPSLLNRTPIPEGFVFDFNAPGDGDFEGADIWGDMGGQEFMAEPYFDSIQLGAAQKIALSLFERTTEGERRQIQGKADGKVDKSVKMTDFEEGPEREIFSYIYGHFSLIFNASDENDPLMQKAVDFIFGKIPVGDPTPGLDEMLTALDPSIRPDLIRLRLIYELWFVGWKIPPLPDFGIRMPAFLKNMIEIKYRANKERIFSEGMWTLEDALSVMEDLWENPGSTPLELYNRVNRYHPLDPKTYSNILLFLIDLRMVSEATRRKLSLRRFNYDSNDFETLPVSRLYLTGENPILLVEEVRQTKFRTIHVSFFDCFKWIA